MVQYFLPMISPRRMISGALTVIAASVTAAVTVAVPSAGASAYSPISSACGSALSSLDISTIARLSNVSAIPRTSPLTRYNIEVSDNQQITQILVAHHDYRGLFAVGLDASERGTEQPLVQDPSNFANPTFAQKFSGALLGSWLNAIHAQVTGAGVPREWQQYFALAHQCSTSKSLITLTGYNAHFNVNIAQALASAGATTADQPDFGIIVKGVGTSTPQLVGATDAAYGTNLGPVWQALLAQAMTIGADAFTNGLALQVPSQARAALQDMYTNQQNLQAQLPGMIAQYGG